MENCSDGFNVPREHTAKLYIVEKRIMGSIGKFCFVRMRNGHVFLKSGLKIKSQNQKKITIKLNFLFFSKILC